MSAGWAKCVGSGPRPSDRHGITCVKELSQEESGIAWDKLQNESSARAALKSPRTMWALEHRRRESHDAGNVEAGEAPDDDGHHRHNNRKVA